MSCNYRMVPGEVLIGHRPIDLNPKPNPLPKDMPKRMPWRVKVRVRNEGDRPVQVGSHYHFYEVNPGSDGKDSDAPPPEGTVGNRSKGLVFVDDKGKELSAAEKRKLAGYRLDIPAGTAERFEPGDERVMVLVALSGEGNVHGLRTEGRLARWKWK